LVGKFLFIFGGYDGNGRSNQLKLFDMEKNEWEVPEFSLQSDFPSSR